MNQHEKAAIRAQRLAEAILATAKDLQRSQARHHRMAARNLLIAGNALAAGATTDGLTPDAEDALRKTIHVLSFETDINIAVVDYVTAPVTGTTLDLDLGPAASNHQEHIRRHRWLRAELCDITARLDDRDDAIAGAAFAALIRLYGDWARLVEDLVCDRTTQPSASFRTADGSRTGEHQPGHLTVFAGGRVIAELAVPLDITAGDLWQLVADAQPADLTEVPA
ncbi:hypothetical protein ACFWVB_02455 [Streptomyces microflavus]|uniref:hypothetical protein n=1 Tax=Streptomyces microflavus TaxID=1919 RepID=UPI00364695A4